jgi:hypothetical protein
MNPAKFRRIACETCEKTFLSRREGHKHCSQSCRQAAYLGRIKEKIEAARIKEKIEAARIILERRLAALRKHDEVPTH